MWEFLFVYDRAQHSYPVRFWIRTVDQAPSDAPEGADDLDGWLREEYADDLLAGLRIRFPEPAHVVERMSGTSWSAVADNFPGLYFH